MGPLPAPHPHLHVTTEHGRANHSCFPTLRSVPFLTIPRPTPFPVMAAPKGHGPGPCLPPTAQGRGGSGEQPYHAQVPSTCPPRCCWGPLRELQVRAGRGHLSSLKKAEGQRRTSG